MKSLSENRKFTLFMVSFILLWVTPKTHADDLQQLMEQVKNQRQPVSNPEAGDRVIASRPGSALSGYVSEWANAERSLEQVQNYLDNDDPYNALRQARNSVPRVTDPELKKIWVKIAAELEKQVQTREQRIRDQFAAAQKKAGVVCLQAKSEQEIEPLLEDFYTMSEARRGNWSPRMNQLWNQMDQAINFLERWQDYVANHAVGNDDQAGDILRDLSRNNSRGRIVARADILALMKKAGGTGREVADVLQEMKPEDLARVSLQINALAETASGAERTQLYALRNELQNMTRAYSFYREGSSCQAIQMLKNPEEAHSWMTLTQRIEEELLLLFLPDFGGIKDLGIPKKGESVRQMLARLSDEAATKGDWARFYRLLILDRKVSYDPPDWLNSEFGAVKSYLAAQNLEKAAQYADAVLAYRDVLRSTGSRVPMKEASERLASLAKDHSEAFDLRK